MKSNVSEFERKENKAKLEDSKTPSTCATGLKIITLYFTTWGKTGRARLRSLASSKILYLLTWTQKPHVDTGVEIERTHRPGRLQLTKQHWETAETNIHASSILTIHRQAQCSMECCHRIGRHLVSASELFFARKSEHQTRHGEYV